MGTDNGRFCFIYDHDLTNDTLGPFVVGEWSKSKPLHVWALSMVLFPVLQ